MSNIKKELRISSNGRNTQLLLVGWYIRKTYLQFDFDYMILTI